MSHLVIKLDANDTGVRPMPANTPFWTCQAITLLGDNQTLYGDTATAVGRVTTLEVQVSNTGVSAFHDVTVEAWVCNYTLGYVGPGSAIPGPPPTSFTGTTASVPAGAQPVIVQCTPTWTPSAAQAAINVETEPDGTQAAHVCVGANAYGTDASGQPVGAALPTGAIDPLHRSEHGQTNIKVRQVKYATPMPRPFMRVVLENRDEEPLAATVTLAYVGAPLTASDINPIATGKYGTHPFRASPHIPIDFDIDEREGPMESEARREGEYLMPHSRRPRPKVRSFKLEPKEQRPLFLKARLSEREEPGNVHVFDAISRDHQGRIMGAARMILLLVE
jgi:hypothetical protein